MSFISTILDQPIITSQDLLFIIFVSLGIYFLRRALIAYLYIPLGRMLNINDQIGLKKFYDNFWYVTYYATMLYYGYTILKDKPFFPWVADQFFVFPEYKDWIEYPDLRFYYLIQISFYVQTTICFLGEIRKKDFFQYCIHHGSTVLLLFFSFMAGQHRIGVNVLFVHDISDIFLHFSKILHYTYTYGGKKWADVLVYPSFFSFFFSFFYTRLYIFPFYIIKEAMFVSNRFVHEASKYYIRHEAGINNNTFFLINSEKLCSLNYCVSPHHLLIALLCVLACLHVFWGYLILKMLLDYVLFSTKKDIRSDEDSSGNVSYDKVKSHDENANGMSNGKKNRVRKDN
eukprot:TRINITY_DN5200_c0_g1_i1.p1 TRINITY_DN5200_c0_g1~~TRINITY_DN5200_c0_g1_i1.p1  ORF type:complete len:343 (-),score=40.13 TRINITY_DN5200_c0_g1_i1:108-1136(-)